MSRAGKLVQAVVGEIVGAARRDAESRSYGTAAETLARVKAAQVPPLGRRGRGRGDRRRRGRRVKARPPLHFLYPALTESGSIEDSNRFGSIEDALRGIGTEFPGQLREQTPVSTPLERWELERQCLRGRIHPVVPSAIALRSAARQATDPDRIRWALHDAWWWCTMHKEMRAPDAAYLWASDLRRAQKAKTAVEALFEGEMYSFLRDAWSCPPCLPGVRDIPAPEFSFFLEGIGSVGVEAKCVAPLNDVEADAAIHLAQVSDKVLSKIVEDRLPVWVTIDRTAASRLDPADLAWLQDVLSVAAQASKAVPEVADGICSVKYLGRGLHYGPSQIPPGSLTLQGWWADRLTGPLFKELGDPVICHSWAEAKVTIPGGWSDEAKRVKSNLVRADKKHGVCTLGISCVRIRPPPFSVVPRDLLCNLWESVVIPMKESGRLANTDAVMLSLMREARVHPTKTRQRFREAPLNSVPNTVPTCVETVAGAFDATFPDALLAGLAR